MTTTIRVKIDFLIVLTMVLLAVPVSIYFNANFLTSTILFFGIPSFYLLLREKDQRKRTFTAAALFGLLFGFVLDYLAELNNAWSWAGTNQLVFPYRILGVVNIDVMIWFFLWVFFIVVFYEHFIEDDRKDTISPNIKFAIFPAVIIFIIVWIIGSINPDLLKFNYAYLVLGILTFFPFAYVIKKKPILLLKFLKASLFFALLYLAYEITALHLDQWRFPGQYIGMIQLGGVTFPFEEFIVWILMSSTIVLSYYELYVDDFK